MKINRMELLDLLQRAAVGLATKETGREQEQCFLFQDGKVWTYNDELFCVLDCSLIPETLAIPGETLLKLLRSLQDEELEIATKRGSKMSIKTAAAGDGEVNSEREIKSDLAMLPQPMKWVALPAEFTTAVGMTCHCVAKTEENFELTCVHVTKDYLESSDNCQAIRFTVGLPVRGPVCVRGEFLQAALKCQPIAFAETKSWLHFQIEGGQIGIRKQQVDYVELGPVLEVTGTEITLPDNLMDAVGRADVFSTDERGPARISIALSPEKGLEVKAASDRGWWRTPYEVQYEGVPLRFNVEPELLKVALGHSYVCTLDQERMYIVGDRFVYVIVLGIPSQEE
jgi:hypothetical protein